MHLFIVLGVIGLLMCTLAVRGHAKKPRKPLICCYQLLLLIVTAIVASARIPLRDGTSSSTTNKCLPSCRQSLSRRMTALGRERRH